MIHRKYTRLQYIAQRMPLHTIGPHYKPKQWRISAYMKKRIEHRQISITRPAACTYQRQALIATKRIDKSCPISLLKTLYILTAKFQFTHLL
jgi:hypothetical protein